MAKRSKGIIKLLKKIDRMETNAARQRLFEVDQKFQTEKTKLDILYDQRSQSYQIDHGNPLWGLYADEYRLKVELKLQQQKNQVSSLLTRVESAREDLLTQVAQEKIKQSYLGAQELKEQKLQDRKEQKELDEWAVTQWARKKND